MNRRLTDCYEWLYVPPDGVEKASRRERAKRTAVMVGTTLLAAASSLFIYALVLRVIDPNLDGAAPWLMVAVLVPWFVLFGYIDMKLFAWATTRFGIVPPWQFRVGDSE